ncbi:MAG: hypothetical protein ABIQ77_09125 [Anaerolineales bacterium]
MNNKKAPYIRFKRSAKGAKGEGVVGPFGEVRIFSVGGEVLPVFASSADGSAVMDITGRSAFVRYGRGPTAITLTTNGVKLGAAKEQPWSAVVVRKLIAALAKDRSKVLGAMLLRSALHTSYLVAAAQSKPPRGKKTRMGTAMSKGAAGYGSRALDCTTRTVTETVTRTITEAADVIKTAEEQYQECYDREVIKDPCKSAGLGAGLCAAGICGLKSFGDLVVGFYEIVTTISEEVTREVVTCITPKKGEWPNPWSIPGGKIHAAVPQPKIVFGQKEIKDALALLGSIPGLLGPFGTCFFQGAWSLAQLDTQLNLGGTNVVVPYGVKVCLSAECATKLSIDAIWKETLAGWGSALSVLAALDAGAAASLVGIGIVPSAAVVTLVAGIPPVVLAAATIILLFILIALIWGTAISSQLWFHKTFTNNFADGKVCIEHPSIAIALITLLVPGVGSATQLTPPIVTG